MTEDEFITQILTSSRDMAVAILEFAKDRDVREGHKYYKIIERLVHTNMHLKEQFIEINKPVNLSVVK